VTRDNLIEIKVVTTGPLDIGGRTSASRVPCIGEKIYYDETVYQVVDVLHRCSTPSYQATVHVSLPEET